MGSLAYGQTKVIDVIYLDFHKVFDTIWHESLLQVGK